MNHNIRLGPAAIFLTVVSIVLVMLSLLTAATSIADSAMAARFASVTQTRYRLEAEGEAFLAEAAEADEDALSGIEGTEKTEAGYSFSSELNGYRIEIEITDPGRDGSYEILSRRTVRIWEVPDPVNSIWQGTDQ